MAFFEITVYTHARLFSRAGQYRREYSSNWACSFKSAHRNQYDGH